MRLFTQAAIQQTAWGSPDSMLGIAGDTAKTESHRPALSEFTIEGGREACPQSDQGCNGEAVGCGRHAGQAAGQPGEGLGELPEKGTLER